MILFAPIMTVILQGKHTLLSQRNNVLLFILIYVLTLSGDL